jgi:curved DNA-binding protein CbpA
LLKRYHPDKFHDDEEFRAMAESKARRINRAWEVLKTALARS